MASNWEEQYRVVHLEQMKKGTGHHCDWFQPTTYTCRGECPIKKAVPRPRTCCHLCSEMETCLRLCGRNRPEEMSDKAIMDF